MLCCSCFVFSFKNTKEYKDELIHIQSEADYLILWWSCKFNILEKVGVKTYCQELLVVGLLELFNDMHTYSTIMSFNKNIFNNEIENQMCRNYRTIIYKIKLNWYPMSMLEELFNALRLYWVFNILDL